MVPPEYEHLTFEFEPDEDPGIPLGVARDLANRGEIHAAATFYNRAYGLAPQDLELTTEFTAILNQLEVREHDLTWRYIPGGVFLMGNNFGEPDERPWHPVWLNHYWIMDTCVSWETFVDKLNLGSLQNIAIPNWPNHPAYARWRTSRNNQSEIYQAQEYALTFSRGSNEKLDAGLGLLDAEQRTAFDSKPMASITFELAELLGHHFTYNHQEMPRPLSSPVRSWISRFASKKTIIESPQPEPSIRYRLPTEAQWEKAARGGLIGAPYSWGWDPPTPDRVDCDRLLDFGIKPMRSLPPNAYGLYGMCGGVWEWTSDFYDSEYYRESENYNPTGPAKGELRVVRGGSWADCPEACTVSFRNSMRERRSRMQTHDCYDVQTPTLGFRLVRTETSE